MSTPDINRGAALEFAENLMGGPVLETQKTVSVATSVTRIVENNADRVGLIIVNLGTGSVTIALDGSVALAKGIQLSANGGSVSLVVQFDLTLCSHEWFGIADASGPYTAYVIEWTRYRRL